MHTLRPCQAAASDIVATAVHLPVCTHHDGECCDAKQQQQQGVGVVLNKSYTCDTVCFYPTALFSALQFKMTTLSKGFACLHLASTLAEYLLAMGRADSVDFDVSQA